MTEQRRVDLDAASTTRIVAVHPGASAKAAIYREELGPGVCFDSVEGASPEIRRALLSRADILACFAPFRELADPDFAAFERLRMVQCLGTGLDEFPFDRFAEEVLIAGNSGAAGRFIGEHAVAMALSACKRLPLHHAELTAGTFDQATPTKRLHGARCAILGLGDIGGHIAGFVRPFGVSLVGVNRDGRPDPRVDRTASLAQLDEILAESDIVFVSLSLNERTRNLFDAERLGRMKPDAILVNVARADLIDQGALYRHLQSHPEFWAALDVWWVEPLRHGRFALEHPFFALNNVLGSPHNSPMVPGIMDELIRCGARNVRRFMDGEEPANVARAPR